MSGTNKTYYRLLGAEVETPGRAAVQVSVTLNTVPVRSVRLWFPYSQMWNDGKGGLFATDWIIKKKNVELKNKGEVTIRIADKPGFD